MQKVVVKLFLDCSDADLISHAHSTGLIDGVTTNPTLMKKCGKDPVEVLKSISELFSWDASISAEVVGETAGEMLDMSEEYLEIGPNITIKVPCTREGLKACKELSSEGIPVNVTLVFSAAQAILASKVGAKYVSPFVGRLNDQYWDGLQLIEEIADIYATHNSKTEVLAASIREARQVPACFRVGADICTIPYDIFQKLYDHTLTDAGVEMFNKDWEDLNSKL
ncbi:MAG: transaldolase family protein [Chitinophagaceae bacterium]